MATPNPQTQPQSTSPEKTRAKSNGVKKSAESFSFGKGINLILQDKEGVKQGIERSMVSHLIASVFAGVALVALAYGALYVYGYYKEQELSSIHQEQITVDTAIASIESHRADLVQFQNTLEGVKKLLTSHIHWTNFFDVIEKNTIPEVTYVTVVMSPDGKVRLSGVAKDFTTLARQLRAFEDAKDVFSNVSITSGHAILGPTGDTIGVSFDATATLKPTVLTTLTQIIP